MAAPFDKWKSRRQPAAGGSSLVGAASPVGAPPPQPAAYSLGWHSFVQDPLGCSFGHALTLSLKHSSLVPSLFLHSMNVRFALQSPVVGVDAVVAGKLQFATLPVDCVGPDEHATIENPTAKNESADFIALAAPHMRTSALPHETPAPSAHIKTT